MAAMPRAAGLGDPITHTGASGGLEMGLIVGTAVVLTCCTGGLAAFVMGVGLCAGMGLAGDALGGTITSATGALASGSLNVTVGGKPMARAGADAAPMCSLDHAPALIATGSATVLVNGYPAARDGSQVACGGVVSVGRGTVLVGGPTVAVMPVAREVPPWLESVLTWSAVVGTFGGGALLALDAGITLGVLHGLGVGVRSLAVFELASRVGRDAGIVARGLGADRRGELLAEIIVPIVVAEGVHRAMPPDDIAAFARSLQGSPRYPGVDDYGVTLLREGTIVYGGTPGPSNYYTTEGSMRLAGGDAATLADGLQVAPHVEHGYRGEMTAYRVTRDVPAAQGVVQANPALSSSVTYVYDLNASGGYAQIVIRDYASVLEPLYAIPMRK